MSRNISPWIKDTILSLLGDNQSPPFSVSKICQVVCTHQAHRSVVISDSQHSIPLLLTHGAIDLLKNEEGMTIPEIKDGLIRIEGFHITTLFHGAADRDLAKCAASKLSFPFAIQCTKIVYMGGCDITTIGNPEDVNKVLIPRIHAVGGFEKVCQLLAQKQFNMACLPDYSEYQHY